MNRIARGSFILSSKPAVIGFASAVGKKESEGPLSGCFDREFSDNMLGEESWEKAESHLQKTAVEICIEKSGYKKEDFDAVFSGDLLNQCIASTFGLRSLKIPQVGLYGACSTMALSLLCAGSFIESGLGERCIAATSSHFSSSERQFRNPLQYGGQRTPTAQWTVTGAGAVALAQGGGKVRICSGCIGIVNDLGVKDANNMGAAMAPAASSTIVRYMNDFGKRPSDFDMIFTGDLGFVGSDLLYELIKKEGYDIKENHADCGTMIFEREKQDVHSGGSGCGCSASVLCAHILPKLEKGVYRRVLFVATGALMSPTSSQQGESIPGVAHAVELCAK